MDTDIICDVGASLGKVPYRSRTVWRSRPKAISGRHCVERNSRASFNGITASFWNPPVKDVALRPQTKKSAQEKH